MHVDGKIPYCKTKCMYICTYNFKRTLQYSCNFGEFLPSYWRLDDFIELLHPPLPSQYRVAFSKAMVGLHLDWNIWALGSHRRLSEMMQGSPVNALNPFVKLAMISRK